MRAIKLRQPAGLDRLEIGTVESSAVGAGQVLVRLHASSLNYHDYLVVTGFFRYLTDAFRWLKALVGSSRG
jgi:NADPH:quinone reductase-like Zn-dependent oxidoreductase